MKSSMPSRRALHAQAPAPGTRSSRRFLSTGVTAVIALTSVTALYSAGIARAADEVPVGDAQSGTALGDVNVAVAAADAGQSDSQDLGPVPSDVPQEGDGDTITSSRPSEASVTGAATDAGTEAALTKTSRGAVLAASADPSAPSELYLEDFETGRTQAYPPTLLQNYSGTQNTKYTASSYWLNAGYCNGFITSAAIPMSQDRIDDTYCGRNNSDYPAGDYAAVRAKSYALGLLSGETSSQAKENHALSTNTSGGNPSTNLMSDDSVMFRTTPTTPVVLPTGSQGRFIAFSVDAANTYCENKDHPKMQFQLVQGGTTTALPLGSGGFIDPCTSAGHRSTTVGFLSGAPSWVTEVSYGTFYSGSFFLNSASPVGIVLRNISPASSGGKGIGNPPKYASGYVANSQGLNGNDGAIDNIRIVDVTPYLTKSFSPDSTWTGTSSTMTLTVHNRSDLGEKNGWSFVDTLPVGLNLAPNATVTGSCITNGTNAKLTPASGDTPASLTVTGGKLNEQQSSCTIVTQVVSGEASTFVNGGPNRNFSDVIGIDQPNDATVKFFPGIKVQKKVAGRFNSSDQFTVSVTNDDPSPWVTTERTDPDGSRSATAASATTEGDHTAVSSDRIPLELTTPGQTAKTYTLEETSSNDAALSDYATSLSCIDTANGDAEVPVTPIGASTTKYTLKAPSIASGRTTSEVVCTFTNTPKARLTLTKVVDNGFAGKLGSGIATWTLSATPQGKTDHAISGTSGTAAVTGAAMEPGTYTLSETPNATPGYEASQWECLRRGETVASPLVAIQLQYGDDVTCTITNTAKPGSVSWAKTDEVGHGLSGSEWALTVPDGDTVKISAATCSGAPVGTDPSCTYTDAGNFAVANLVWGAYTLKETKAPAGYVPSDTTYTFTIDGSHLQAVPMDGATETPRIVNVQSVVPDLPLTGGLSTDAFLLGGGGLLALAGLGGFIHRRRSLRVAKA